MASMIKARARKPLATGKLIHSSRNFDKRGLPTSFHFCVQNEKYDSYILELSFDEARLLCVYINKTLAAIEAAS